MAEVLEAEIVDVQGESVALQAVERANVDVQVSTAKQYPRSITDFKRKALAWATSDESTAAACFYSLERSGKKISGPSVRLAEIVGSCWGNMRCEVLPPVESERSITLVGLAWDLETNFAQRMPIRRRITNRKGERYNEDMINVTAAAATSIARRNAIFAVVPRALVSDLEAEVKKVAAGKGLTMEQRRERVVKEYAEKFGATQKQVLLLVRRKGLDDVSLDDIIHLKGLVTAIVEGEINLAQAIMEATGVVETETLGPKMTPVTVAKDAEVVAADGAMAADGAKAPSADPVTAVIQAAKAGEPLVAKVLAAETAKAEGKSRGDVAEEARKLFT